ncbi:PKD domain protein [uncultured archaeon]|nr:PKD domain protein [uncultured archaeon]
MKRLVMFALGLILILSFVSADFSVGKISHSTTQSYSPGETIIGWANISLTDEPSNSLLISFFDGEEGNNISLMDLIRKDSNAGFEKTCSPSDCNNNYEEVSDSGKTSTDFGFISDGDSKIFGLKVGGDNLDSINNYFSLSVASNAQESDVPQLSIDILNDGQIDWQSYKPSVSFGGKNYGCYVSSPTEQPDLTTTNYCENMTLPASPNVTIGANIIQGTGGSASFRLSIQGEDGDSEYCDATTTTGGEISCSPKGGNFKITEEQDFFVCIKAKNSVDSNKYKINRETSGTKCGYAGTYTGSFSSNFEIFAQTAKYASVGSFVLNNTELKKYDGNSHSIESEINDYILSRYNNDCSDGCIIPIKFSGLTQSASVSNAVVKYTADEISTTAKTIYNLTETPALISTPTSSRFQRLYLDEAGFNVPEDYGNYTFSLNLNDDELFFDNASVEASAIRYLTPTTVGINYPATFTAGINSATNATEYTWNFGDSTSSEVTTTNKISHTYTQVGTYVIIVSIIDVKGKSYSKQFSVIVQPASEIVPALLDEAEAGIANVKVEISNFSQFEKESINNTLNLGEMENNITQLRAAASTAASEADYEAILEKLIAIKIPTEISSTASGSDLLFYPQESNVDLEAISKIYNENYDLSKSDAYKNAVVEWNVGYVNAELSFNEISYTHNNYEEPLVKVFDIVITNTGADTSYFVIRDAGNILLKDSYSETRSNGYIYIPSSGQQEIVFSTTEDVDFTNLPMFVSPALSKLTLPEVSAAEKENNKWATFAIIAVIIVLAALIIWVAMQIWYKKKYENHLFKNQNNLLNVLNYIKSSKEKGMNDKDIIAQLKKSGWNSEQAAYAMKKYSGKSVGILFGKKN